MTSQDSKSNTSEFKSKGGIKRIWKAIAYSLEGLQTAFRFEHAFRQELVMVVIGFVVVLVLPLSIFERLLMTAVLVQVLVVELINSAIEAVVDRVSLERHPLSKNAKDFGSAAVLLTVLIAIVTWAVILWNRFYY